jgi:hypothetical protein
MSHIIYSKRIWFWEVDRYLACGWSIVQAPFELNPMSWPEALLDMILPIATTRLDDWVDSFGVIDGEDS